MNTKKILGELGKKYPGKNIIKFPEENPTEILCEIEPTQEHPEYSLAVSVIEETIPHKHIKASEEYSVLEGEVYLHIEDQQSCKEEVFTLKQGQSYIIKSNTVHWATGDDAWITCKSAPGWTEEDHILINLT